MKEPLNSFARRIIQNDEVTEFIQGLVELGANPVEIKKALEPQPDDPWKEAGRFRMDHGGT